MATLPHPVSICLPANAQGAQLNLDRGEETARPTPFKAAFWNVDGTEMSDYFEPHTPWGKGLMHFGDFWRSEPTVPGPSTCQGMDDP